MKIVFGEPDNMFRLAAAALASSPEGDSFLREYFRTEGQDGVNVVRNWIGSYRLPAGIDVVLCEDEQRFVRDIVDATVVVVEKQPIKEDHLNAATSLKLVIVFGHDLSGVDTAACARRNIGVKTVDRQSNRLVAEQTLLLMLALTHNFDEARRRFAEPSPLPPGNWAYNWVGCPGVRGLPGRTVGLVGFGEIARVVASYLRPFAVRLLYTRRTRNPKEEAELGLTYADLEALFEQSDVVSIHIPGTADNRNLIGRALLEKIKPGAFIVNTSRGSVIDETALIEVLQSGRVAGAGLDVFATEPSPADHPFRRLQNVILTPHLSAGTRDEAWLDGDLGPIVRSVVALS